jgi:hypothetical protein
VAIDNDDIEAFSEWNDRVFEATVPVMVTGAWVLVGLLELGFWEATLTLVVSAVVGWWQGIKKWTREHGIG